MTEQISFREWLVERVMTSAPARYAKLTDEQLKRIAKRMGVQVDVLIEARVRVVEQALQEKIQPPLGDKVRGSRHYQFKIAMPEAVFRAWRAHAEDRGVDPQALLRSLIHHYLLGSDEPTYLLRKWLWQGKMMESHERTWERTHKAGFPFRERALLTNGVKRALERRAQRKGCAATAIVRGLVLDTLEGKHPRIKIVDARTLYDDEDRYLL